MKKERLMVVFKCPILFSKKQIIINMKKTYKTLAIETSCDDTSVAIVASDGKTFWVENMLAYSQVKDHQPY
jgi:hypothetical protein